MVVKGQDGYLGSAYCLLTGQQMVRCLQVWGFLDETFYCPCHGVAEQQSPGPLHVDRQALSLLKLSQQLRLRQGLAEPVRKAMKMQGLLHAHSQAAAVLTVPLKLVQLKKQLLRSRQQLGQ